MTFLSKSNIINKHLGLGSLAIMFTSMASLYAPLASAAPIYKVVDEQTGQVTFTDAPQSYEQAGSTVSQTGITTTSPVSTPNNRPSNNREASAPLSTNQTVPALSTDATKQVIPTNYQLTMTEPSEARAYRRPAQTIAVTLQIKPALQAGDSIRIYLDGNEVAQGLNASIATVDILPGAHTIEAMVYNKTNQTLAQVTRTVYIIQNNVILQNNKKIAKQLLAYQNLPWHQKVMLKLRQRQAAKR